MERRDLEGQKGEEMLQEPPHHHYSAPEVEERKSHEYEGVGIGRRESLRGEDVPPAHHEEGKAPQHK